MRISELIEELEDSKRNFGDIECVIEVFQDDVICMLPFEELRFENRNGYGSCLAFLC